MNEPNPPLYPLVVEILATLKSLVARLTRIESRLARLMIHEGVQVDSRAQEKPTK